VRGERGRPTERGVLNWWERRRPTERGVAQRGRPRQRTVMALSLTPTQSGLLPIVLEPGVALTLGRLSKHGIERCKECRKVSRSQCIFRLRDGRLYAQNVGKGLIRAHRGAAAGDSHLVAEMDEVELLAGDQINLVILEDDRSESTIASWQVPTRDAWPSAEPQGAKPPALALSADVKPEQPEASGNPPAPALSTDARLPARTPLTTQPPGCKRVAMTPLSGELPSRHQSCESEPPLVSPQAPQPPQPPQPQQMLAPPSHPRLPAIAARAASGVRGLPGGEGASEGASEGVSDGGSEQGVPAGQVLLGGSHTVLGGSHTVLLAQLTAAVESTVASVLRGWDCQPPARVDHGHSAVSPTAAALAGTGTAGTTSMTAARVPMAELRQHLHRGLQVCFAPRVCQPCCLMPLERCTVRPRPGRCSTQCAQRPRLGRQRSPRWTSSSRPS
jgi:hypothetical protein